MFSSSPESRSKSCTDKNHQLTFERKQDIIDPQMLENARAMSPCYISVELTKSYIPMRAERAISSAKCAFMTARVHIIAFVRTAINVYHRIIGLGAYKIYKQVRVGWPDIRQCG